jgi:hypothetical protein
VKRFIFRFRGEGETSEVDVARIRSESRVVDDSSPRMLLVEAPVEKARELARSLKDWAVSEERQLSRPNTRPKIKGRNKPHLIS